MKIIGLTGGIASGKTTVAGMFAEAGIDVHNADAEVHGFLGPGGAAVRPVAEAFGDEVVAPDGGIDRALLASRVFGDDRLRRRLESILHPMVAAARDAFIESRRRAGAPAVALDVPLLFETGGERMCDFVVLCACDVETQRARAMARPGMTEEKFTAIVKSQMPLEQKRAKTDVVIDTSLGLDDVKSQLWRILRQELDMDMNPGGERNA